MSNQLLEDGARRVVIEDVQPAVDGGRFPAKRIAGDLVIEQVAGRGTRVRLRLPEHPTPSEGRT